MSSARSDDELLSSLRELVEENAERLFGLTGSEVRVDRLLLSRPRHRTQSRYHRALTVRYSSVGELREKRIWLKFLPRARDLYEIHMAVWARTRETCELFPQPYFHAEWNGGEAVGMELVEGVSLRKLFLRRAFTRRTAALSAVFTDLGKALRAFHDCSEPSGLMSTNDLLETARQTVTRTEHLTDAERERALECIVSAAARAGDRATLPLIPVHHDCTLRNVVVRHGGYPCLLDLDSMRASWKSRWYDVAVFLINLESQAKYSPLADADSIASGWRSFLRGYVGAGPPDGLSREQMDALLFLIKVELLFGGPWRPLFDVYTGFLASRYLGRLKKSVLGGDHLVFGKDVLGAA